MKVDFQYKIDMHSIKKSTLLLLIVIVISDYAMPGFSGLEALHLLREQNRETPFILVSGTVGEEIAVGVHELLVHSEHDKNAATTATQGG